MKGLFGCLTMFSRLWLSACRSPLPLSSFGGWRSGSSILSARLGRARSGRTAFWLSSRMMLALLLFITACAASPRLSWSDSFSAQFDSDFREAGARWLPDGPDWLWLRAQGV